MSIVASNSCFAFKNDSMTVRQDLLSRLPVGSSANIKSGFMSALATAVRCFSPPDISAGYFFLICSIPNSSHRLIARFSICKT